MVAVAEWQSPQERLPPHNVEAEQSVLGSLLIDRDAIIKIASYLKPNDFYHRANGTIYEAILDLYNKREPTDFVTLTDELGRRERLDMVGGVAYLSALLNVVPTAVHVEYYGRIVERTATLRRLIDAGSEIVGIGFRDGVDTEEALDAAQRVIFQVSERRGTKDFQSIAEVLDRFFDQIDYMQQHRGEVVGTASGYADLDQLTGGLQKSDLIIIAARPSVGKTAFALGVAYGAAVQHQKTVGIFSLEMSAEQLVQRLLSMETGVDSHRLRLGQIDDNEWDRISRAFGRLAEANIFIDDSAGLNVMELRSKARRLQAEHGLNLVIVDYLQLMSSRKSENRVQEISEISRSLKGLARELNVPVVALSQLSRAVETRADHRPMLSDLRESGCLTGETPVYLPDSGTYRPIAELVGQRDVRVLALNPETWRLEPRPVVNAFSTGSKPVYRLKTRLGRTVQATANHKFLTIHGWQRLDELAPGISLAIPHRVSGSAHVPQNCDNRALHAQPTVVAHESPSYWSISVGGSSAYRTLAVVVVGEGPVPSPVSWQSGALLEHGCPVALRPCGPREGTGPSPTTTGTVCEPVQTTTEAVCDRAQPIVQGDVYWDDIVSIESAGEADVFDLTVEGLHNFVAGDIVVHNSIEQDADIVMFIYRDEVYDPNTEKKGIAEIIVAKHRNGPVGTINLRFFDRTARFADLELYRDAGS